MDIKTFIKQFIPPILLDLFRACRNRIYPRYTWEGIYLHYNDVPSIGPGFACDSWVNSTITEAQDAIAISKRYGSIPMEVIEQYALLPVLASIVFQRNGGKVRILDFGGGVGIAYVHLLSSLVECPMIDYHVVELEWACQAGSRLFEHDSRIHFHRSLPNDLTQVDALHMNGVLQCIEDYAGLLKALCGYRATYFLIGEVYAGDFPTFASSLKNMPETVVPYWFFNVDEIVEIMKQGGYSLILRGATKKGATFDNFPKADRVDRGRACNLLFAQS